MTAAHRQALVELDELTARLRDGVEALAAMLRAVEAQVFTRGGGARAGR